jgi:hypothetical protein
MMLEKFSRLKASSIFFYLFESNVDIFAKLHVLEHSLKLGCEPTTTLLLQFGQHALFRINTGRLPNQKSFCQIL